MSIETVGLGITIGKHALFSDVNVACEPGQILALVGVSGSGKTTLLGCMGLLVPPTTGEVVVDGRSMGFSQQDRLRFWRNDASFVYQDYGIIDDETVAYNVAMRGSRRSLARNRRLQDILAEVGLEGRGDERAAVLSGGEKQRLGLARALYKEARFVFADEPTASLDADNRKLVLDLIRRSADNGAAVVLATHDEQLAAQSDIVYRLGS